MAQEFWKKEILLPLQENSDSIFSIPFSYGVSDRYYNSTQQIMIVGQEPNDFGTDNNKWPLSRTQVWDINYTERQLYGLRKESYKYNPSPFWNFFRLLSNSNIQPSWNNVDKIHRYVNGKTRPLSYEQEAVLNKQYLEPGEESQKSLLQREIEITKPSAIVFVTGPLYDQSICHSFGLKLSSLKDSAPNTSNYVSRIESKLGLSIPTFWTYHPNYLNYSHELDNIAKQIEKEIL